jgi:uncharacterized damage-inducible protein DinB
MSAAAPSRPEANEYAAYYEKYISLVPDADIVETLERQLEETLTLLGGITEERSAHRYEEGKWSIKQVVGHINDAERIFAFRALAFARGDTAHMPSMDPDDYMKVANFDERTLADLSEEFAQTRRSNILMFRGFSDEAWTRRGIASDNEVSVRALVHIIAGHVAHHSMILRERYL